MSELELCAICGERPATTRDHVPPAAIFPKPRPSDLVTVPCCLPCNNGASPFDERFGVYLAMHVSRHEPNWESTLGAKVLRTVRHNQRLRREILEDAEEVMLRSPSGLHLGRAVKIQWDSEAHDRVVERIIRGLHYHHTGEIVGASGNVRVHFLDSLEKVGPAFEQFPLHSIGGNQLLYKCIHHPELPLHSVWVFEFRGWKWSGGAVTPAESS